MTYDRFDLIVFPIFIYYIFLSVFGIFMTLQMIKKWKQRKEIPPFYLSLVFGLYSTAIVVLTIGLAEAAITGYYKEIYRFSLPLAYSVMVVGNAFLYIFASNITNKGKSAIIPVIISGIILIIIFFLPWNWWGYPSEDYKGKLNIRLYTNLFFVAYSYIIYINIAIIANKIKKKSIDKIVQTGLTLLFWSMICMICFFLMILADNVLIVVYDHPGYSGFIYIAWIFAILFIILSYLSLVMPKWLVKRIENLK